MDETAKLQELKKLENQRQTYITKLFVFAVQIAFIFAIPAFTVLFLGKVFGGLWNWIGFPVALILSWTMVALLYKKLHKKLKSLDEQIKLIKSTVSKKDDENQ